jgi:branched-chain amino acid transport system ATP-binding protein
MLKINNLNVCFGAINALKGVSFDVPLGKIVTLIGANGAGKSTTLRTICGLTRAREGTVKFEDQEITNFPTNKIVQKGVVLIPEGRRIFPNLTVKENLILGAFSRTDNNEIGKDLQWIYSLFPRIKERLWQKGGTLSGGEQQMLAISRGLMSRPKLLMMDEPSLGLAPKLVQDIFKIIEKIREDGITILLIEQNAFAALRLADYAYVLETGNIVLQGTGTELLQDARVKKAYLGESE